MNKLLIACGVHPTQALQCGAKMENSLAAVVGDDKEKLAQFLTCCLVSSDGFRVLEDSLWFDSAEDLKQHFCVTSLPEELKQAGIRNPFTAALLFYRDAEGNESSLDAWRYRPRGVFPVAGKAAYWHISELTGLGDMLVKQPEFLGMPDDALLSAVTMLEVKFQPKAGITTLYNAVGGRTVPAELLLRTYDRVKQEVWSLA